MCDTENVIKAARAAIQDFVQIIVMEDNPKTRNTQNYTLLQKFLQVCSTCPVLPRCYACLVLHVARALMCPLHGSMQGLAVKHPKRFKKWLAAGMHLQHIGCVACASKHRATLLQCGALKATRKPLSG
jgi:hypothetical protein